MHKITTETATSESEFTDGDVSQEIEATDCNADWFNTVQRELCNAITRLGSSLSATNDHQLADILQLYGFTCDSLTTGNVTISFPGNHAIFHNAASFTISGTMNTGAFLLIVPRWGDSSPDYIDVTYDSLAHRIYKWQAMVGIVTNNGEGSSISWWPIIVPKSDGTFVVKKGEFTEFVDKGYVEFENANAADEGLAPWQVWQLKSYWKVGQVKRVRCTNVTEGYEVVTVFKNTSGQYRSVKFYENGYREFMCVGQYTSGNNTFAVLLVNGAD